MHDSGNTEEEWGADFPPLGSHNVMVVGEHKSTENDGGNGAQRLESHIFMEVREDHPVEVTALRVCELEI